MRGSEHESSIDRESRTIARGITGNRIGPKRYGLDAVVQSGALLVAADEAEAGSTTQTIAATGHLASVGDFIQFTGGNLSGQTFAIESVATDTITLAQTLPEAPAATDGFDILRLVFYRVGASGEIVISGTVTADAGAGFAQAVHEDDDITGTTDLLPAAVKDGTGKAQALVQPTTPADTQPVSGTFWQATQPVSAASLPLPTGAATAANQSTIIGHVDGIEGALTTLNAKDFATQTTLASALTALQTIGNFISGSRGLVTEDNSAAIKTAVELIDNCISGSEAQVDIVGALPAGTNAIGKLAANSGVDIGDVDVLSIAAGTNAIGNVGVIPRTSGGLSIFRSIDLDESEEEVKSSAGQIFGWYIFNAHTATLYVKFYNATAANTTVGTTTPILTIPVPAGAAANVFSDIGIAFGTALSVAATTGLADNDTGAPAANVLIINLFYA